MPQQGLDSLIVDYIEDRKQSKLDAFDKEAQKKRAADADPALEQQLAEERRELEQRYSVPNWLTYAAARAGQISLVSHAIKYTHSDARGSSILSQAPPSTDCLTTASLTDPAIDAVGNAAALDVAKLLQLEWSGDSLLTCLQRQDHRPLQALAENPEQLKNWIDGFSQALGMREPSSHKLAKQIYFPVAEEYHLLGPLFSSSLAHTLHQRITDARFSEQAKEARRAQREDRYSEHPVIYYPNTAIMQMGGTKPQNISYLNSVRGGRVWLLPCAPPQWRKIEKPPLQLTTLFAVNGPFVRQARRTVAQFRQFLQNVQNKDSTQKIRRQIQNYLDVLIDQLFNVAADLQRPEWQGWTADPNCQLKAAQQLWLDPYRTRQDNGFKAEREQEEWQFHIADDFAVWLNNQLRYQKVNPQQVERREWRTRPLLKRRLHDMEKALAEELR